LVQYSKIHLKGKISKNPTQLKVKQVLHNDKHFIVGLILTRREKMPLTVTPPSPP
jgi:hypothetical protein